MKALNYLEVEKTIKQKKYPWDISWHLFATLNSTQDYLKNHTMTNNNLQICCALEQTAGVGRRNTPWQAPLNAGIYCSIAANVLEVRSSPWSLMIAAHIAQIMQDFGFDIKLKWPNDILINGLKCAGILVDLEPSAEGVRIVIGFGINLYQHSSMPKTSIALHQILDFNNELFLLAILDKIFNSLSLPTKSWLEFWQRNLYQKNKIVTLKQERQEYTGKLLGIDAFGAVLIEIDHKVNAFYQGRLFFSDSPMPSC